MNPFNAIPVDEFVEPTKYTFPEGSIAHARPSSFEGPPK
jgi:hypothetical protein